VVLPWSSDLQDNVMNNAVSPFQCTTHNRAQINLLKTKRNLLYIRNQSVPRCKHFLPRL